MTRINWHDYFMSQTQLLSLRSTCTRLKVGAIIVKDNRVISSGYNGSVSGEAHCIDVGCLIEDGHCIRTIHAEINAILQCSKFGVSTEGASIYVTHFPCVHCSKSIVQAGIKNIFYAEDYKNHEYAEYLFEKTGVNVERVPFNASQVVNYLTE